MTEAVTNVANTAAEEAKDVQSLDIDVALQELEDQLNDFSTLVQILKSTRDDNSWQYVSKGMRNNLLRALLDRSASINDMSKACFQMLKKIKRVRPDESYVDMLITGLMMNTTEASDEGPDGEAATANTPE